MVISVGLPMLTGRCSGEQQPVNAFDQVVHIAKTAGLHAIAVDGQRLTAQRLLDKVGHGAAIIQAHARPIGIEDAHDARVQMP
jgi:hypothetical protein